MPVHSFVNMHPLAYQCNLILGASTSDPFLTLSRERLTGGEPTAFATFLNTFALGVGSLEVIQLTIARSSDAMLSNRLVQGVESIQLVLTLAGSICGLWL